VTSTTVNDKSAIYTVEGIPWYYNYFYSTDLTATHADGNPLILTQVGTSMTDQAIPILKALGTIAVAAVAIGAAGPEPREPEQPRAATIPLPVGISISELLKNISGEFKDKCNYDPKNVAGPRLTKVDRDTKIICKDLSLVLTKSFDSHGKENTPMHGTIKADIIIDAVPPGALRTKKNPENGKEADIRFPFKTQSMIYSACRPMQITLNFTQKIKKERDTDPDPRPPNFTSTILDTSLIVADSDWVQTIAMPSKGSVKFSSSCGADSIPSDFTQKTILDDISQAVQSAKSVSDALKKPDSKSTSGVTK